MVLGGQEPHVCSPAAIKREPHHIPKYGTDIWYNAALRQALERIGYVRTYHMMCASVENPPDCLMWRDALAAKYDGVGHFGRKEWDQLLGDCQVILSLSLSLYLQ